MGFKIDFTIEGGDLIDDHCSPAIYSEDIKVSGNSISDTVCISQNGQCVGFTTSQYRYFIIQALKSSLFYDLK